MLRPLDLQDNFSKAPLAAREQNLQQIRPEVTQHNLTQQLDQENARNQSRIRESAEADEVKNRVDDHDRQPGYRERRQRQQQDETAPPKDPERIQSGNDGHIDIII